MVFITAGMGGGTGTGASPVIAGIAKNLGALTIAIVEKPFNFEGRKRMESALQGIAEIKDKVDTMIVVPNQRLLDVIERNISFMEAMKKVDDVLAMAVKSISELITQGGMINVDFADIKSIMLNAGTALMGMGLASGEDRAKEAAKMAMESPLLEASIEGATGVLFNIIGGDDLAMYEIDEIARTISEVVHPDANIFFGANVDPAMDEQLQVTVLATGFDTNNQGIPIPTSQPLSKPIQDQPIRNNTSVSTPSIPKPSKGIFDEDDDDYDMDNLESTPSYMRRKKEY